METKIPLENRALRSRLIFIGPISLVLIVCLFGGSLMSAVVSAHAQNEEPSRSLATQIARKFFSDETDVDLSYYVDVEYFSLDRVVTIDFKREIPDPPDSPLKGRTARTSRVFIDKRSLEVVGYVGKNKRFENKFPAVLTSDAIQAVINFIGAKDSKLANYTPQQYVDLFRLQAIDAGEMYMVEIIHGPQPPDQLYIGGGYQFYLAKKNNEVLGFAPTF